MLHIVCSIAALAIGALVILNPKGTPRHRVFGYIYIASLFGVNVSALSVYQQSVDGGPFHVLAVVSLMTLVAAVVPVLIKRPVASWLRLHAYFINWSYVGLVGAGIGQLGAMLFSGPVYLFVGLPIVTAVGIGAWLIHTKTTKVLKSLAIGGDTAA